MRRKVKVDKKKRAKVSGKSIPERINELENNTTDKHGKYKQKIMETLQEVQIHDVEQNSYNSDCTCFSIAHAAEDIYSPVLEDFLTELNLSKPKRVSCIEENGLFPTICSYCKHISTIPNNIIQSINNRALNPSAKYKVDLSFLQAIVWLKAVRSKMHEIKAEEHNLTFNLSTRRPEYSISQCPKKIIETSLSICNKQYYDQDSLSTNFNKPEYDLKRQDSIKLNKKSRSCARINNIEDPLKNDSLTPQRWNNSWMTNKCISQTLLIPESDEELTVNSDNIEDSLKIFVNHNESNFSEKPDSAYETLDFDQDSIDLFHSINEEKQDKDLQKKRKIVIENKFKEKKKNITKTISNKWVNFTLRALDIDNIVIESMKIILAIFKDENIIKEHLKRKNWVDTLEKEALDVILNVLDIFRIEMKPDVCIKEVIETIKDVMEEIYRVTDSNKVTLQIYHISIILEFCNSLYICDVIIDFLMIKLQNFQITLKNILKKKFTGFHNIINKVHLVLYALSICLQKYMINIRNSERSNKGDIIPEVINLWRKQWNIDWICSEKIRKQKNIEHWANSLEAFTITCIDDIPLLAEKSRQLYRLLITQ